MLPQKLYGNILLIANCVEHWLRNPKDELVEMAEMTENKEIKEFNTNHSSNAHKALVHSNFAKLL